jgi:hypothetical protein
LATQQYDQQQAYTPNKSFHLLYSVKTLFLWQK